MAMQNEPQSFSGQPMDGTYAARMDALDQRLERVAELLESVIAQLAVLSEQLTRFENAAEKRLDTIDSRIDRLASISEQQSATAASLAATVATLIQRAA